MKILLILTGGTIGASISGNYIGLASRSTENLIKNSNETFYPMLLDNYEKNYQNSDFSFDFVMPFEILSENLSGKHINMLYNCILENIDGGYDGIIITHGTDTLQYTAAGIGYLFAHTNIPIVFVASNYVLDDPRENGNDNFKHALDFIRTKTPGVFVSFKNDDDITYIHYSTRLIKHASYDDNIYSIENEYACTYTNNKAIDKILCDSKSKFMADMPGYLHGILHGNFSGDLHADMPGDLHGVLPGDFSDTFSNQPLLDYSPVLFIDIYPGQMFPALTSFCQGKVKAVLLNAYHSGTICTDSEQLSTFCMESRENKIPIFLIGGRLFDCYESTKDYQQLGIQVLKKASPIAIYMKLWLYLSNTEKFNSNEFSIYDFLNSNIAHDIIE